MSCVTIGHASHSSRTASQQRYNLAQQVQHKINVVTSLLDREPNAKIILAGHSVGAYILLEVLRHVPDDRWLKGILLFPTVDHIGASINGRKLMPLLQFGRGVVWTAAAMVGLLPRRVQRWLAGWHLKGSDAMTVDATLSVLHPEVAWNAMYMAMHEMKEILSLDHQHARKLQSKLVFYFGAEDNWVNPSDPDMIRQALPGATVVVCKEGHRHAFVLKPDSVARMAALTWSWLREPVEAATALSSPSKQSSGGKDARHLQDQQESMRSGASAVANGGASAAGGAAGPASPAWQTVTARGGRKAAGVAKRSPRAASASASHT